MNGSGTKYIRPIFILSLPRSGSTLLQRITAAHDQIATTAEPWLLLPFFYTRRSEGVYAEYNHRNAVKAYEDFITMLPQGEKDYNSALRCFALRLYRQVAGEVATHFVDKTPRYCLISDKLIQAFPDGKFIFLWRNPLAVAASIMRTWGKKERWNLNQYEIDLYKGLGKLISAYAGCNNCISIKYESLVENPRREVERLHSYLEIPMDSSVLDEFSRVDLSGRMGDPTGIKKYNEITDATLGKWKTAFCNPLRRRWARRYLDWLGRDRLEIMGYKMDDVIKNLEEESICLEYVISDILRRSHWAAQNMLAHVAVNYSHY